MVEHTPDDIANAVLTFYTSLGFRPPAGKFTILAAFVLSDPAGSLKPISLGTGSKCLPASRLQPGGDMLHDSHAEVIARRGAVRWLLEETGRAKAAANGSPWLAEGPHGRLHLASGVRVYFYVSTVPCGDASTRYLATFQDAEMAALKDSGAAPTPPPNGAARGRDGYSLYGVLRTKPGRADSPPTLCMSCSDKVASWNVLGIQGALAAQLVDPVYIDGVVIGEVDPAMREAVREDCERALWGRLASLKVERLPECYALRRPPITFTSVPFVHSRQVLGVVSSCNDSLCWIGDSQTSYEVVINGLRRGVPPKHRHNPKFRPLLSKIALFSLYRHILTSHGLDTRSNGAYYREAKLSSSRYQIAKTLLREMDGPFAGWVRSGEQWDDFEDGVNYGNDETTVELNTYYHP